MAPSPPKATAFRPAEDFSVLVGTGGAVPVMTVELAPPPIAVVANVVGALVVWMTVETTEEVDFSTAVAVTEVVATWEVTETTVETALETAPDPVPVGAGTLKLAPAPEQSSPAAAIVSASSFSVQAAWTQGTRPEMKLVAVQIHGISVTAHPVLDKLVRAQVRAHCGMLSIWAETREAVRPAATAMKVVLFILKKSRLVLILGFGIG
jgi:hypothetical protein